MPLFPEIGPTYLDEKDRDIKSRIETSYAEWHTLNAAFWSEADIDTRFDAGDQTVYNDVYGNVPALRHRNFIFNRIRRVNNLISGYQRRNRKSTVVIPVENASQQTADQFTKILFHINRNEGVYETISDAFHGATVTGMNLLHVWQDYRRDPVSGNIKVDNCSYNSFLIDPFFRKADLSDCNGIWKRSYLTKGEVISLNPEHAELIAALPTNDNGHDNKFQFMPENYNYAYQGLMTYDEYYYRGYRQQRLLVDKQTGEVMEWRGKSEDDLQEYLDTFPEVELHDQEIPTVKLAILAQGKVIYHGPNPLGIDRYPFVPVFAYYNPQMPYYPYRIQGVTRGLRDAQFLYNRRQVIIGDIFESQINSGFKYKENALINPEDIFLTGQGRGLALKEEAQMSDVEQIQAPQVPPSMFQYSEALGNEIPNISGVNEELLGAAVDDKAGVLAMLRQGAGLTTLQVLYDNLDRAQKILGSVMIEIIQSNYTPGKIQNIVKEQPSPEFYNKNFGRYDAAVEEGVNTTTQRQLQFAQLIQLKELGVPIPDDVLIENATLQDKKELTDRIAQQQQQEQQMKQMQEQIAMQEQQAKIQLAQARATADQGLGLERISRVEENQALADERYAEALKDRFAGILDLSKAMKEMEGVDLDNLVKLMNLARLMREEEIQQATPVRSGLEMLQQQQEPLQMQGEPAMEEEVSFEAGGLSGLGGLEGS